jgi:hypothetical protein
MVDVNAAAAPLQTENAAVVAGTLDAIDASPQAISGISLPSKSPAISKVTNGDRTLAVDAVGNLFLSRDAGVSWQQVPQQWIGKATKIERSPSVVTKPAKKEAESTRSSATVSGFSTRSPISSARRPTFELTTESGQIWLSFDGVGWTRP